MINNTKYVKLTEYVNVFLTIISSPGMIRNETDTKPQQIPKQIVDDEASGVCSRV